MAKSFGDSAMEAFGGAEQMAAGAAAEAVAAVSGEVPAESSAPINQTAASPPPAASAETAAAAEAAMNQPAATPSLAPAAAEDIFLKMARERGFQVEDSAAAQQAILRDYEDRVGMQSQYDQALAQARDRMQFASEAEQWWSDPEIRQVIQGKFYQRPAQQQPAAFAQPVATQPAVPDIRLDDIFQVPTLDTALVSRYRVQAVDATTGQVTEKWREDTPIAIRQQYDDVEARRQAWANQLVNNPAAALQPVLARAVEVAEQRAMQRFEQQQAQRQESERRQRVQQKFQGEDSWVYETDPATGTPRVNPFTGNYVLSEAGAQAARVVTELEQQGIRDPEQVWNYARAQTLISRPDLAARILNFGGQAIVPGAGRAPTPGEALLGGAPAAMAPAAQPAPRQTPQARTAQRQNEYLRQRSAATPPSRDGVEQPNGRSAARRSFGDAFFANMEGQPAN